VCLHADRLDDAVRAPAAGRVEDRGGDVVDLVEVDHLDAVALGHGQALGNLVDRDDPAGAQVAGDPGAHLADRAETGDHHGVAGGDVGVLGRLP
jgi:hypothetical protein